MNGSERASSNFLFYYVLVDVMPDSMKGWETFGFPMEMGDIFGRKVDMVFEKGLYHLLKDRILSEAIPI